MEIVRMKFTELSLAECNLQKIVRPGNLVCKKMEAIICSYWEAGADG